MADWQPSALTRVTPLCVIYFMLPWLDQCHFIGPTLHRALSFFFFLTVIEVFYFFILSCHEFIGKGFQQLRLLCIGSHTAWVSGWSRLMLQLNPSSFFFGSLLWSFSFTHFRKRSRLLRVLNALSACTDSLSRKLARHFCVYNNAHCMLGDIVDSSSLAKVTLWGIPFWTVPIPLMSTISPFLYICRYVAKGTTSRFLKRPGGHTSIAGASLLSLCVSHFGELPEESGFGQKGEPSRNAAYLLTHQKQFFLSP